VTRNGLLAYAAQIGGVSAVFAAAARMIALWEQSGYTARGYTAADTLDLVSSAVTIAAFAVAWAGFQRVARQRRLEALSVAAGLFAAGAAAAGLADLIRTAESISLGAAWKFTATETAWTAGRVALVAAAVLVVVGLRNGASDAELGRASLAVAAYAGLFAAAYGFELTEVISFPAPFSPSGEATGGLGLIAGGWVVVAVAAVLAAAALYDAGVRRARGEAWRSLREGMLARSAVVFAAGFAVSAAGFMLYTRYGRGAEQWLEGFSQLGLAAAAGCAAVAFLGSRRRILQRGLEQSDGSDLAVLSDPG